MGRAPAPAVEAPGSPLQDPAEVAEDERAPRARRDGTGARIADAARYYLDHRPRGFRDDCSGFVSAALARAGITLSGSTASLWELAREMGAIHHRKLPEPGDIAFFDDTYDRNHDGRVNDELSHVAVVLEVHADGDILLAHGGTSHGRTTLHMNLKRPSERTDAKTGDVLNDYLRRQSSSDPGGAKYLSGELWRGFATFSTSSRPVAAWDGF
jgi:hypothetical protein